MFTMFIRHKVKDYGKWKRIYDENAALRENADTGIVGASIHRDVKDANEITVVHQVENLDAAMAFAHSEELKAAMADAGVIGPPDVWFTEDVERTPY